MHLGIISTIKWHPWGGSEELWASTAKLARQRGVKVSACFIRPRAHHPKWQELENAGVQMFYRRPKGFVWNQVTSRVAALSYRFAEHVLEQDRLEPLRAFFGTKPDLLLINEGGGIPERGFLEMLGKTMPKIPYIALFHNNFEQVPADSWRRDVVRFFQNAEAVLFVSEATLRATERNLAIKLSNAQVVRNPVNLESIHPEPWPEDTIPHFASVGALDVSRKGQDLLLEALSAPAWGRREWRLSVFGAGENRAYLEELTAYHGLANRVQFHGEVRGVRAIWHSHHALVVSSRIESAPLVIVEAMLCGRPVIATDAGGIGEWVKDGRNGFLCGAGNAKSLEAALERAWDRRNTWQALGARARADAVSMYDPNPAETLLSIVAGEPKPERLQLALAGAL